MEVLPTEGSPTTQNLMIMSCYIVQYLIKLLSILKAELRFEYSRKIKNDNTPFSSKTATRFYIQLFQIVILHIRLQFAQISREGYLQSENGRVILCFGQKQQIFVNKIEWAVCKFQAVSSLHLQFLNYMKSNLIQIRQICNQQKLEKHQFPQLKHTKSRPQQANKADSFHNTLSYLQPKNHKYFKKQYINQKGGLDCSSLVNDFMQCTELVGAQQKKAISKINSLTSEDSLDIIFKILGFYSELSKCTAGIMQKMVKLCIKLESEAKNVHEKSEFQLNRGIYCNQCKTELIHNQIQSLKNDLQIRDFQDKYNFYRIDAIKLYQLRKLRNYSNLLLQSELHDDQQSLNMGEKPISFQQFQEILNLLGSDIHRKNSVFQHGIADINQLCEKNDSEKYTASVQEHQLKYYQLLVGNKEINKKLRLVFKKFFNKYNKMRADKRIDAQIQVSIKESDVIRDLQKERKDLKMKMYRVESQRMKENTENNKTIADLNTQTKELQHQIQQFNTVTNMRLLQYQQRLCEQKNLVQLVKNQLSQQIQKYSKLQMEFYLLVGQKTNQHKISKKVRTLSKRRTQFNSKKQNMSPKKSKKQKSMFIQQFNKSLTDNALKNEVSDANLSSHKRFGHTESKKGSRNTSILQQKPIHEESKQEQAQKIVTYQSIKEKKQEQQNEEIKRSKSNKFSRFRMYAGLSRFNNENENNLADDSENKLQNSQNRQLAQFLKNREKSDIFSVQRASQYLLENILNKLYDHQLKSSNIRNISYDDFSLKYQKFIKQIHPYKASENNSQSQSKDLKQKSNTSSLGLSRVKSLKNGSHLSILKKRQNKHQISEEAYEGKKVVKLQPLSKKSNYFLQKSKHFSAYEQKKAFSAFTSLQQTNIQSIIPQNHQQNLSFQLATKYTEQKSKIIQKLDKELMLKPEQITSLFLGKQKIKQYQNRLIKNLDFILNPQENHFMMNVMTLFAQLHLSNLYAYEYLKNVTLNPRFWINTNYDLNTAYEEQSSLQNGLKNLLFLHRGCLAKDKQKSEFNCGHLQMFKSKIQEFIEKHPRPISMKKEKNKANRQKFLNQTKSSKISLTHI